VVETTAAATDWALPSHTRRIPITLRISRPRRPSD
jgi:hypothetical protein